MNTVHVGWLIFVSVMLGIALFALYISFKINRDYVFNEFVESQKYLWLERRTLMLGKLFKGYILQNKQENIFLPDCFLVQADDYNFDCTESKNGIEVKIVEKKDDSKDTSP